MCDSVHGGNCCQRGLFCDTKNKQSGMSFCRKKTGKLLYPILIHLIIFNFLLRSMVFFDKNSQRINIISESGCKCSDVTIQGYGNCETDYQTDARTGAGPICYISDDVKDNCSDKRYSKTAKWWYSWIACNNQIQGNTRLEQIEIFV